ncbi:MAG TPA: hypothetical protein DIW30_06830 [Bacteroidales bacterium]|nr:hypothetical protein [Bacteroidales bacterium]
MDKDTTKNITAKNFFGGFCHNHWYDVCIFYSAVLGLSEKQKSDAKWICVEESLRKIEIAGDRKVDGKSLPFALKDKENYFSFSKPLADLDDS